MRDISEFLPCKTCQETMPGIFSYEAREVCSDCGGEAKINNSSTKDVE